MTEHITAAEFRKMNAKGRKSKYGNRRITIDSRTYDSVAEAKYCEALLLRQKAGEVTGVELQRPFVVYGPKGEVACTYKADAAFWDFTEDRFRVIDVKGVETKEFKLKRRLLRIFLGIEVEVIPA